MAAKQMTLSRAALASGRLGRMVARADPQLVVLNEAQRQQSLSALLETHPPGTDVWVFGYGSLIWNTTIRAAEHRIVHTNGFHRRLCVLTRVARGSPDHPGLMLGLDRGGSCAGKAFRIVASRIRHELDLLWRREMVDDAYRPAWIVVRTPEESFSAIAFVARRGHRRYVPPMADLEAAQMVAGARGRFGFCLDYVAETSAHLDRLGIPDRHLARIASLAAGLVSQKRRESWEALS
jgi:glutathione-specific gamma-glutamylcyclotransferase